MKLILSLSLIIFIIKPLSAQDEKIKDTKLDKMEEEIWSFPW